MNIVTLLGTSKNSTAVIPAQAGIQILIYWFFLTPWIPACAGMTDYWGHPADDHD